VGATFMDIWSVQGFLAEMKGWVGGMNEADWNGG